MNQAAVRWQWLGVLALLTPLFLVTISTPILNAGDVTLGRRIYQDGVLPSGSPLRGKIQSEIEVRGASAACAACHRRSGYGADEGGYLVPKITGPALFQDRLPDRGDLFRGLYQDQLSSTSWATVRTPRIRAAYTAATLAVALRSGNDPTGRSFDPLMPRYALSEGEVKALVGYLQSLGSAADPAVDASNIHLGTVVSDRVDPGKRRAMIAVLNAFIRRKNLEIRGENRPGFSPHYKSEFTNARREWVLHVWELKGLPRTWDAQLVSFYRSQPVFALLSGCIEGSWQPVHDFCERSGIPCLFPATEIPALAAPETDRFSWTIYFSRGLPLEAEALARWIVDDRPVPASARIMQVYRNNQEGATLASAFRRSLVGDTVRRLEDQCIGGPGPPARDFWPRLVQDSKPSVLVLWLRPDDLSSFSHAPRVGDVNSLVCLSATLLGGKSDIPPGIDRRMVRLTWPRTLPGSEDPAIYRVRSWLDSQRISRDHETIELNTYFGLLVAEHAFVRMVAHFSREYFLECIEHETERTPNPGVFPRLSLGPGQRNASKGCYIVAPSATGTPLVTAVSDWIVP